MGGLNIKQSWRILSVLLLIILVVVAIWTACEREPTTIIQPQDKAQKEISLSKSSPQVQSVMAIQNKHTENLLAKAGVVGTATAVSDYKLVIKVFTKKVSVKGYG